MLKVIVTPCALVLLETKQWPAMAGLSIILELKRQKQQDFEFEASLAL